MRFTKQTNDLANALSDAIVAALEKYDSVLWLIPGGSNIPISVEAMANISSELSTKLTLAQTDERYVSLDDPDNNWHQLVGAGLDTKQARPFPVIIDNTEPSADVANRYDQTLFKLFSVSDYVIGQFGIGADGHIAGAKPNSIATKSGKLVESYQAEDFERITMTLNAISKINEAIAFVSGASKSDMLRELSEAELPVNDMPALVMNSVKQSTVYNDLLSS